MTWNTSTRRRRLPADWPTIRRRILQRDPTCTDCHAGPATEVDHVTRGDDHSDGNLTGLCTPCHGKKSSAEGHAARPRLARPAEAHPGLIPLAGGVGSPSPPDRYAPEGTASDLRRMHRPSVWDGRQ